MEFPEISWVVAEPIKKSANKAMLRFGALFFLLGILVILTWYYNSTLDLAYDIFLWMMVVFEVLLVGSLARIWQKVSDHKTPKVAKFSVSKKGLKAFGKKASFEDVDFDALKVEIDKLVRGDGGVQIPDDLKLVVPLKSGKFPLKFAEEETARLVITDLRAYLKEVSRKNVLG